MDNHLRYPGETIDELIEKIDMMLSDEFPPLEDPQIMYYALWACDYGGTRELTAADRLQEIFHPDHNLDREQMIQECRNLMRHILSSRLAELGLLYRKGESLGTLERRLQDYGRVSWHGGRVEVQGLLIERGLNTDGTICELLWRLLSYEYSVNKARCSWNSMPFLIDAELEKHGSGRGSLHPRADKARRQGLLKLLGERDLETEGDDCELLLRLINYELDVNKERCGWVDGKRTESRRLGGGKQPTGDAGEKMPANEPETAQARERRERRRAAVRAEFAMTGRRGITIQAEATVGAARPNPMFMRQLDVAGDGNCLYRAFARAWFGTQDRYREVVGAMRDLWAIVRMGPEETVVGSERYELYQRMLQQDHSLWRQVWDDGEWGK